MTYILNIETATPNCSVSLALDGKTIECLETSEKGYSHAELLHVYIRQVTDKAGITLDQLHAVAVSRGPGSYTGLRIGVSAAKGLCYALGIPLISVDTMEVLARAANCQDGLIIPMLDARRMEVYSAVFDAQLNQVREIRAEIITEESFSEYPGPIYFVGDCASKCSPLLAGEGRFFLETVKYPSASQMSAISYDSYKKSDTVDVAYFEPYYLKDFFIAKKGD
jgi:tRNA threonylcarbamoyladenosine biosynthesis protein TsaB